MNCPICSVPLLISDRQGIKIDYCPTCRGIWLDRGELDKIIERSMAYDSAPQQSRSSHDDREHHGHHYGKKKSFFSELFD